MDEERNKPFGMFGTCHWAGHYNGCPAIVLSYYKGAHLWACTEELGWERIYKGTSVDDCIPCKCSECGTHLPFGGE